MNPSSNGHNTTTVNNGNKKPKSHDNDSEKGLTDLHASNTNHTTGDYAAYVEEGPPDPWRTRFVDSFRRDPNAAVTKPSERAVSGKFDHEAAARGTANSGLARKLKGRHLQMIAIGGSIGMCIGFQRFGGEGAIL